MSSNDCIILSSDDEISEQTVKCGTVNNCKSNYNWSYEYKSKTVSVKCTDVSLKHERKRIKPVLLEKPSTSKNVSKRVATVTSLNDLSEHVLEPTVSNKITVPIATSSAHSTDTILSDRPNSSELFHKYTKMCSTKYYGSDMEIILSKLLKAYNKTDSQYKVSTVFRQLLSDQLEASLRSDFSLFPSIKLILDELKFNKFVKRKVKENVKITKKEITPCSANDDNLTDSRSLNTATEQGDDEESDTGSQYGLDEKTRKKIMKLEKLMRGLNKAIKQLEVSEVDWDDEDDSSYIKLSRYRSRINQVYDKICNLKKKSADADRQYKRKIYFTEMVTGSGYPDVDKAVEKVYNHTKKFPDFHDIVTIVKEVKKNEQMTKEHVRAIAMTVFKEFGTLLKNIRMRDDYNIMCSYMTNEPDPAAQNEELRTKLSENYKRFVKEEAEVMKKYTLLGSCAELKEVEGRGSEKNKDNDFLSLSENENDKEEESDGDSCDSKSTNGSSEISDASSSVTKNIKRKRYLSSDSELSTGSNRTDENRNKKKRTNTTDNSDECCSKDSDSLLDYLSRTPVPESDLQCDEKKSSCVPSSSQNSSMIMVKDPLPETCWLPHRDLTDPFFESPPVDCYNNDPLSEEQTTLKCCLSNESEQSEIVISNSSSSDNNDNVFKNNKCKTKEKTIERDDVSVSQSLNAKENSLLPLLLNSVNIEKCVEKLKNDTNMRQLESSKVVKHVVQNLMIKSIQMINDSLFENCCAAEDNKSSTTSKECDVTSTSDNNESPNFTEEATMICNDFETEKSSGIHEDECKSATDDDISIVFDGESQEDVHVLTPQKKMRVSVSEPDVFIIGEIKNKKDASDGVKRELTSKNGKQSHKKKCSQTARLIMNGNDAKYVSNKSAKKVLSMGNSKVFTKGVKINKKIKSDELIILD